MMTVGKWFCHIHPQEFLINGDCRICFGDINWMAKFEAGKKWYAEQKERKNEYTRKKRKALVD